MKWSKLKQLVEERFATEVKGRVSLFYTRYRPGDSVTTITGRILIDKEIVAEYTYLKSGHEKVDEEFDALAGWDFSSTLFEFLNTSIEDALHSQNPLMKTLAILDKRVGKRRLKHINPKELDELQRKIFALREKGINITDYGCL